MYNEGKVICAKKYVHGLNNIQHVYAFLIIIIIHHDDIYISTQSNSSSSDTESSTVRVLNLL